MSISVIEKFEFKGAQSLEQVPHFAISRINQCDGCEIVQKDGSEYFNVFLITTGSGNYKIDFKAFEIDQAGIFFLSPGQVFQVDHENIQAGYQISFDKDFYCVETHGKEIACNGVLFNNVHKALMLHLDEMQVPFFEQMAENISKELQNPGIAHRAMLETYLRMFLIQALRILEEQQPNLGKVEEETNRLVADFIALVEKHFQKIHSVSEYAQMLFVSPKSLAKRLNALGYPKPTEIIQDRILLQAKRALRFSDLTIKEIAFNLGFEDPGYFSRLFSKKEGLSPLAYRATNS